MLKKILLTICFCASSCSFMKPTVGVIERTPLNLPDPPAMHLSPIEFVVIHKDNSEAIFSSMISQKEEPVMFCVSGTVYKNLATNMQTIKSHLISQKKVTRLYRKYYENSKDGK